MREGIASAGPTWSKRLSRTRPRHSILTWNSRHTESRDKELTTHTEDLIEVEILTRHKVHPQSLFQTGACIETYQATREASVRPNRAR